MISKSKKVMLALSASSAILMSLPFLVPGLGPLALVGFVPLLCLDKLATDQGMRKVWLWHYGTFLLWNTLTVWWICNATLGGGIFAIMANALQMSLIWGLFRASKKLFRGVLPYLFLMVMWIAWERWYFATQISFPWLVLGNAFAGITPLVQWYEFTGTLGGSLWIWACNLTVFGLIVCTAENRFASWTVWAKRYCILGTSLLFAGPIILSLVIFYSYKTETSRQMDVVIAQPNIDPYSKFFALSQAQQNGIIAPLIEKGLSGIESGDSLPKLVLTPETFTRYILTNEPDEDHTVKFMNAVAARHPGTNILLGAATKTYYFQKDAPNILAWPAGDGLWFNTHNSALMLDGTGRTQFFHKSKLVVGTELTPYPEIFVPLDNKLGGMMARDIGQEEITLLDVKGGGASIPVGCAICYESVYGEYCTGYVRKGAEAMTIITNDAWWGNTPGYRQHFSYARLRAIELRRDIARCGNTGISGIINSRGDVVVKGPWWEESVLTGIIHLRNDETFFVRAGDVTGRICTMVFLLLFLAMVVRRFIPEHLRK
ncbi:MAG: apolipoprotein N-acyltransferase [Bacteroidales bacterium]|nr:apolipoprotein N-acyltransferase [Bacteroidales bacterium]